MQKRERKKDLKESNQEEIYDRHHFDLFKILQERNAHFLSNVLPLSPLNLYSTLINGFQNPKFAYKNLYRLNFLYRKLNNENSMLFYEWRSRDWISIFYEILNAFYKKLNYDQFTNIENSSLNQNVLNENDSIENDKSETSLNNYNNSSDVKNTSSLNLFSKFSWVTLFSMLISFVLYFIYLILQRMERKKIYLVRNAPNNLWKQRASSFSSDYLKETWMKRRQGLVDMGLR